MKIAQTPLVMCLVASMAFACAAQTDEAPEDEGVDYADLTTFRSALDNRGALPFEDQRIAYPEDARPFRQAYLGLAQTPGKSKYVAYEFRAGEGDGVLVDAFGGAAYTRSGGCDRVVRLWLLDGRNRVVRSGTVRCSNDREEGLETRSDILRFHLPARDTYKLVVTVLPGRDAEPSARRDPWNRVVLFVTAAAKADLGTRGARCQDGIDAFCEPSLRCERARCK
jgi:hypothetical protein